MWHNLLAIASLGLNNRSWTSPSIRYRVFIKYCVFFSRILESLPPLPRQHSAAIGCTNHYQPIGVTVNSHCVESLKLSYSNLGEGDAVNGETKFSWTPCIYVADCNLTPSLDGMQKRGDCCISLFWTCDLAATTRCTARNGVLTQCTASNGSFT